jgi:glycosyltransferase involved in cell wall biosynthesis
VRVHVVDPAAYTPPYDDALCRALARGGAEVTLVTSRFVYGSIPPPAGYERRELFYRTTARLPAGSAIGRRARTAGRLAQHVPDMLRYRRAAAVGADVIHFQWLPVQPLDGRLLPGGPLVLTAHDILPREPRPGQLAAQRRLYGRFDAIVVHSEHGRGRLTGELGVDPGRVHVIPHGAFAPGAVGADRPSAAAPFATDRPVALLFGLLRPYKGLEDLLRAWRGIEDAELWVVGMPRFDVSPLRRVAPRNVRFLPRWVSDEELAGCFARADLVVLPYREADSSGVAFTALGAGTPLLTSDVGGFPELAATGAARTFPAGDVAALRSALVELLGDDQARARMAASARVAAAGPYSWDAVAQRTIALYETLLPEPPR